MDFTRIYVKRSPDGQINQMAPRGRSSWPRSILEGDRRFIWEISNHTVMLMDTFTHMLITSLKVLSSEALGQLRYLGTLGISGNIDELALEFDDVALLAKVKYESNEITEEQYKLVERLATQLDEMSGIQNKQLWTEKALINAPQWKEVREHAKACLNAFQSC